MADPRGNIRVLGDMATMELSARKASDLAKKYASHGAIVASVVPGISTRMKQAFGKRAVLVDSKSCGLAFDYPKPEELGADRLAAAAAVRGPAIIVACGTATTFNVLDARGRFCGGVIAPGLGVQLTALVGTAAQLPKTALASRASLPARSTRSAIQTGVLLNFQGGVREILQRLRNELKTPGRVVVTGGYASYLKGAALGEVEVRPLLVFEGLHIIAQRLFPAS